MHREMDGMGGGGESIMCGYRYSANQGLQTEQLLDLIITEDLADNLETSEGAGAGLEYFDISTDDVVAAVEVLSGNVEDDEGDVDVVIENDIATAERILEGDDGAVEPSDNDD